MNKNNNTSTRAMVGLNKLVDYVGGGKRAEQFTLQQVKSLIIDLLEEKYLEGYSAGLRESSKDLERALHPRRRA